MRDLLLLVFAALAACVIPLQAIINGRLGQVVANPFLAALISFFSGFAALVLVLLATTPGVPSLPPGTSFGKIPWHLFSGGVLGAVFVTTVLVLVPRIGAANVIAATIVGQLIMSVVIEHFGILGAPQSNVTLTKVAGCALLICGMLLIQRR
ncbi:MAG: DMT family transporter [Planctomycetaceae bacterium]